MIIHITKDDIEKGRLLAHEKCGCPIWCSVVRELRVPDDKAEGLIEVSDYETLTIGKTTFKLPPEAVSLQRILVEFPQAYLEELTFVAEVDDFEVCSDESDKEVIAQQPVAKIEEKPSLLAKIFG